MKKVLKDPKNLLLLSYLVVLIIYWVLYDIFRFSETISDVFIIAIAFIYFAISWRISVIESRKRKAYIDDLAAKIARHNQELLKK